MMMTSASTSSAFLVGLLMVLLCTGNTGIVTSFQPSTPFSSVASSSRCLLQPPLQARRQEMTPVVDDTDKNNLVENGGRRQVMTIATSSLASLFLLATNPVQQSAVAASPRLDVNNALAREYTAFPGLFPTVATKIFKNRPYTSKKDVYAVLNEVEAERLKQYDSAIVINKVDDKLLQFKNSQICKYECGSRVSSEYRDEQIRAVQKARR